MPNSSIEQNQPGPEEEPTQSDTEELQNCDKEQEEEVSDTNTNFFDRHRGKLLSLAGLAVGAIGVGTYCAIDPDNPITNAIVSSDGLDIDSTLNKFKLDQETYAHQIDARRLEGYHEDTKKLLNQTAYLLRNGDEEATFFGLHTCNSIDDYVEPLIPDVASLLNHPSLTVQLSAAYILKSCDCDLTEVAPEIFTKLLGTENRRLRSLLAQSLPKINAEALMQDLPLVLRALDSTLDRYPSKRDLDYKNKALEDHCLEGLLFAIQKIGPSAESASSLLFRTAEEAREVSDILDLEYVVLTLSAINNQEDRFISLLNTDLAQKLNESSLHQVIQKLGPKAEGLEMRVKEHLLSEVSGKHASKLDNWAATLTVITPNKDHQKWFQAQYAAANHRLDRARIVEAMGYGNKDLRAYALPLLEKYYKYSADKVTRSKCAAGILRICKEDGVDNVNMDIIFDIASGQDGEIGSRYMTRALRLIPKFGERAFDRVTDLVNLTDTDSWSEVTGWFPPTALYKTLVELAVRFPENNQVELVNACVKQSFDQIEDPDLKLEFAKFVQETPGVGTQFPELLVQAKGVTEKALLAETDNKTPRLAKSSYTTESALKWFLSGVDGYHGDVERMMLRRLR